MNFQQLRAVREAVRCAFNLTEAAAALHTSQPGVSRQIRELEDELGVAIFLRAGKRLTGLSPAGATVLPLVEALLQDAQNLQRASADFASAGQGRLTIAATHSQARYALPPVVRDFSLAHPGVQLRLHQGSPRQIARWLLDGEADIGIATEALADEPGLVSLPCYTWTHCLVVPQGHALQAAAAAGQPLPLQALAQHPVITYEAGYTGRRHIDEAFARQGLVPNIVLEAMDADVVKTYAELGMGVGIIAAIAFDEERDRGLCALDARHLFASNTTRLALRRGSWLRDYAYAFITQFAPPLSKAFVQRAMAQEPGASFEI